MKFRDLVKDFLDEAKSSKKDAGYKAMAKSAGTTPKDAKQELKKLDDEGVMADIKKRANKADNPDAYKWGTIRSIIKKHVKKNKG
jgi:hypothetical protein